MLLLSANNWGILLLLLQFIRQGIRFFGKAIRTAATGSRVVHSRAVQITINTITLIHACNVMVSSLCFEPRKKLHAD